MINRLSLDVSKHSNFIGCWMLDDSSVCNNLIEFFERNKDSQKPGVTTGQKINELTKKSTDMSIIPTDLKKQKFRVVSTYIEYLKICYLDYLEQWEFLQSFLPGMHIGAFNI